MRAFELFIEDDRYTVPTLDVVTPQDARRAVARAREKLEASPHCLGVEIWEGERVLARLVRAAGTRSRFS